MTVRLLLLAAAGLGGCATAPAPEGAVDLLVFAPHPDDEALGCAGILRRAIASGRRVKVVFFTDGDGFPAFAARLAGRPREGLSTSDFLALARYRRDQARNAIQALGGRPDDLVFLGFPDAGLDAVYRRGDDAPFTQPFTGLSRAPRSGAPYVRSAALAEVVDLIRTSKPREIYVTSEADTHRDHQAAFRFVRDAVKAVGYTGPCRTYLIHGGPEWPRPKGATPGALLEARASVGLPWPPPFRVALTPEEAEAKRRAILAHSTHLEGVEEPALAEERVYLESFVKAEEVFWPF